MSGVTWPAGNDIVKMFRGDLLSNFSYRKLRLTAVAMARVDESYEDKRWQDVATACEQYANGGLTIFGIGINALAEARKSIDLVYGWLYAASYQSIQLGFEQTLHQLYGLQGRYDNVRMANAVRDIIESPDVFSCTNLDRGPCPDCEPGEPDGDCDDCAGTGVACVPWPYRTPLVMEMAKSAYGERLPNGLLNSDTLCIMSDALIDAGLMNHPIIEHLRQPGPHYLGCWAVDAILQLY